MYLTKMYIYLTVATECVKQNQLQDDLHANGYPWNGETLQAADQRGHDHIVEWARANGCPDPMQWM